MPIDTGRCAVGGWRRRARAGWFVRDRRGRRPHPGLPEEGEEDKHGEETECSPADDSGVPSGRQDRVGDGAPPGTRPCAQQHPPSVAGLSQPRTDPQTMRAWPPFAAARASAWLSSVIHDPLAQPTPFVTPLSARNEHWTDGLRVRPTGCSAPRKPSFLPVTSSGRQLVRSARRLPSRHANAS